MGQSQSLEESFSPPKLRDPTRRCGLQVASDSNRSCLDILHGDASVTSAVSKALAPFETTDGRSGVRQVKIGWQRVTCPGLFLAGSAGSQSCRLRFLRDLLVGMSCRGFRLSATPRLMRKAQGLNLSSIVFARVDKAEGGDAGSEAEFAFFDLPDEESLSVWFAPDSLLSAVESAMKSAQWETRGCVESDCRSFASREVFWYTGKGADPVVKDSGRQLLLRLMEAAIANDFWPEASLNVGHNDTVVLRRMPAACAVVSPTLAMVSLERKNLVRLASADSDVVKWLADITRDFWSQDQFGGVQSVAEFANSVVVSLNDHAWRVHYFDERCMYGKLYLLHLLQRASQFGWLPLLRVDKNDHLKSSILLHRQQQQQQQQLSIFCLALMGKGMLRACKAPLEVRHTIRSVIFNTWYKEVYTEFTKELWWGMNIGGEPWSAVVLPSLSLILSIVEELEALGWRLLLTCRTSGVYSCGDYKDFRGETRRFTHSDVDTFYFGRSA